MHEETVFASFAFNQTIRFARSNRNSPHPPFQLIHGKFRPFAAGEQRENTRGARECFIRQLALPSILSACRWFAHRESLSSFREIKKKLRDPRWRRKVRARERSQGSPSEIEFTARSQHFYAFWMWWDRVCIFQLNDAEEASEFLTPSQSLINNTRRETTKTLFYRRAGAYCEYRHRINRRAIDNPRGIEACSPRWLYKY